MATQLRYHWTARFDGMSRRERQGCDYDAYVPDPLLGWGLAIPADIAADIADAEYAVHQLNDAGTSHVSLEGLARFLLRAESVGSSMIEGLAAGTRRLIGAEVALARGGDTGDQVAVEVLGNIAAMQLAVERASTPDDFDLYDLLAIHQTLMDRSATLQLGGRARTEQNWIGGNSYDPCRAAFVPPPPDRVPALLDDLLTYVNGDDHSPLVQAALAHAQFETIHPFADGNGRTGRALIHVVLRRRGLAPKFVPPISLVLATWSRTYITGLTGFRHLTPADSPERSAAAAEWLRVFATATQRACLDAERYANEIDVMTSRWRHQLGRVRANSGSDLLVRALPGAPVVSVESASRLIGRSKARTADAVTALADAGILRQRNIGRQRYRVFEATDVLDLFTGLERALASPTGDTVAAAPVRPVPARPLAPERCSPRRSVSPWSCGPRRAGRAASTRGPARPSPPR
ncbi:MAG: Fic family protein [Acidimicrobiia bacterium]|nr:Fic family protein [Acidimicrobiia bacterium]